MDIIPFKIDLLNPPKDDLLLKIKASDLTLGEHDVVALSSKVVSIWQGRCVPKEYDKKKTLIEKESDWYLPKEDAEGSEVTHTITNGILIPSAGIDPFGDYYILWPENPQKAATELLEWFKKTYGIENLYLIITDSRSVFLRRGVVGIAIAWAGFEPLYSNQNRIDLLGKSSGGSQTNIPDSLAAIASYLMGEANEQTPLVRMRGVSYIGDTSHASKDSFEAGMDEDLFAPFLKNIPWRKGKK
jgi:F420-0:gamma-glutamyl ligase